MPQHLSPPIKSPSDPSHASHTDEFDTVYHDIDDLHIEPPSSGQNARAGRKSPGIKGGFTGSKRLGKGKYKSRPRVEGDLDEGECFLLQLPLDVLHTVLGRIPPRSLLALSATCRALHAELQDELIWKHSYVNRYVGEGTLASATGREAVRTLVQGCQGQGIPGRGWKKEGLAREAMLERWVQSKQSMVVHHPQTDLIDAISLSYPPYIPAKAPELVVGKNHGATHATPSKASPAPAVSSSPLMAMTPSPAGPSTVDLEAGSPSTARPPKLTHRQKYEALLAATTRPAPHVLSVSIASSSVIKSDPLSGKASKGFWGPGQDANFHLRPTLDFVNEPSATHIPARHQSHVLWGMSSGNVVHTAILSRQHTATGARAMSVNTSSTLDDKHDDRVLDIWSDRLDGSVFVTASQDGTAKLWHVHPGRNVTKSGKRTPNAAESVPARLECVWTSPPPGEPFPDRSDGVRFHQTLRPDPVILARCASDLGIVCSITEDGDLGIWRLNDGDSHIVTTTVRIDAGAGELHGPIQRVELEVRGEPGRLVASVLVLHKGAQGFQRHTVFFSLGGDGDCEVQTRQYMLPIGAGGISTVKAFLQGSPAIAPPRGRPSLFGVDASASADELSTPATRAESVTESDLTEPEALELPAFESPYVEQSDFGRFVVVGTSEGVAAIFAWDSIVADGQDTAPIRVWEAAVTRITAVDYSCGLVAVGSCDGSIKVFDPLPASPELLRSFRPSHISEADMAVASDGSLASRYYTPNNIVIENDMIAATIGRKVFAWKAGTGKGREKGKTGGRKSDARKASGSARPGKGGVQTLDMKALHKHAAAEHEDIQEANTAFKVPNVREVQERRALEELGLGDGEEALQYAMMLSMEQPEVSDQGDLVFGGGRIGGSTNPGRHRSLGRPVPGSAHRSDEGSDVGRSPEAGYDSEEEALRAVAEFQQSEERELREAMALIERQEAARDARSPGLWAGFVAD